MLFRIELESVLQLESNHLFFRPLGTNHPGEASSWKEYAYYRVKSPIPHGERNDLGILEDEPSPFFWKYRQEHQVN